MLDSGWPIHHGTNHGVSEAFYLADPDSNGIELYADRPPDQWPTLDDGRTAMVSQRINAGEWVAQWEE